MSLFLESVQLSQWYEIEQTTRREVNQVLPVRNMHNLQQHKPAQLQL